MSLKGMIESVLNDLTIGESIETTALKVHMIARMLKNEDFSTWVYKELNGYNETDKLPNYRVLRTKIIANLIIDNGVKTATIKNHDMPLYQLGKDDAKSMSTINVLDSIISIHNMSEKESLGYSITGYERSRLESIYQFSTILSAHKPVNPVEFKNIVYQFKSKLLDTFMDLNDNIFNDEIDFDLLSKQKDIQSIVNQYINAAIVNMGEGNIQINNSNIDKR